MTSSFAWRVERDPVIRWNLLGRATDHFYRKVEIERKATEKKQSEGAPLFAFLGLPRESLLTSPTHLLGRYRCADGHGDARADGADGAVEWKRGREEEKTRAMRSRFVYSIGLCIDA